MIEKAQLKLDWLVRIWWAVFWRGALVGGLGGAVLGFLGGVVLSLIGRPEAIQLVSGGLGLVAGALAGFWAIRVALTKRYRGFELILQETEAA